jgi:hypothetical protein
MPETGSPSGEASAAAVIASAAGQRRGPRRPGCRFSALADAPAVPATARGIAALGNALMDWGLQRDHGWVELGALEPPALDKAAAAEWQSLLRVSDILCFRLNNPQRPGDALAEAIGDFRSAHAALGDEIARYCTNAGLALDSRRKAKE